VSILIDTHVFLWAGGIEKRLPTAAREILADQESPIFFSVASAWEIAIKWSKGRLDLPKEPFEFIKETVAAGSISQLTVTLSDACAVGSLPFHHKDPFDRVLIAQARNHGLRLMTAAPILEKYDVDVIALWLDDDE
jgi:PIN domain nuclease of toxin-antitoxin system